MNQRRRTNYIFSHTGVVNESNEGRVSRRKEEFKRQRVCDSVKLLVLKMFDNTGVEKYKTFLNI